MQCPKCSSHTAVKCEIAYEQGKTTSTVRGSDGTSRDVTSLSAFAQRAAPPISGVGYTGGGMAVVGFIWVVLNDMSAMRGQDVTTYIGWIAIVFALLFIWRLLALPKYFRARTDWQNTWICGTCGHKFMV